MEKIAFQNQTYYLTWHASDRMPEGVIKQVSGYIFNADNELLIVKVGDHWTIPGGTPEGHETPPETLTRELWEEACVIIKEPKLIGHVYVEPEDKSIVPYCQLRYVGFIAEIKEFTADFEASRRLFIPCDKISDYITWHDSSVFQAELAAAQQHLKADTHEIL